MLSPTHYIQTYKQNKISSAKIWPGFLANRYAASLMIPKDSDLTIVSEVLKANILLLDHSQCVTTTSVMNPNIRVASLIIVIEQALHATTPNLTTSRHIGFVYALAFQPLWRAWFYCVNFFQYRTNSYLQLQRLVTQVPDPCPKTWGLLSMIPASIKTTPSWENAKSGHLCFEGLQVFGHPGFKDNMHFFCVAEDSLHSYIWHL